jgi:hypothetical protein
MVAMNEDPKKVEYKYQASERYKFEYQTARLPLA